MHKSLKILFIGDVIGKPGRQTLKALVPRIVDRFKIDFVIANGENSAAGFGINEKVANEIFASGVDIITSGNHIWDKKEAITLLCKENRILRPANYPKDVPGSGSIISKLPNGEKIAVINISGRVFMNILDCPFRTFDAEIAEISKITKVIIVDFHAEATSEKSAFAYYIDGRASAVIGTHTHVQTADERILPLGTAFITDVGMTGPKESIIGVDKEQIINKFLFHMPKKYNVAEGVCNLNAVIIGIDPQTGKSLAIERLQITNP